jgi:hypothetical protein
MGLPAGRGYYGRVEITVSRNRRPPWIVPAIAIVAVLLLWRFSLGMLMFAALTG